MVARPPVYFLATMRWASALWVTEISAMPSWAIATASWVWVAFRSTAAPAWAASAIARAASARPCAAWRSAISDAPAKGDHEAMMPTV